MRRLIKAYLDLFSASLEAKAAELREYAGLYPERQWWRGYAEGVEDGRRAAALRAEEGEK